MAAAKGLKCGESHLSKEIVNLLWGKRSVVVEPPSHRRHQRADDVLRSHVSSKVVPTFPPLIRDFQLHEIEQETPHLAVDDRSTLASYDRTIEFAMSVNMAEECETKPKRPFRLCSILGRAFPFSDEVLMQHVE